MRRRRLDSEFTWPGSTVTEDMTSFIIDAHVNRPLSWKADSSCAFCKIVNDEIPNFRLHETDKVIAILDIMPLRRGHALVIPKVHCSRISELPSEYAAAVGEVVTKVANALTKALDNSALNVVCNQEYAQAVPHVHYHIIPAPNLNAPAPVSTSEPLSHRRMHQAEFEKRDELDDEDAEVLLKGIRAHL